MNYIIFTVIAAIVLAYIIVHSFIELWNDDYDCDVSDLFEPRL